MQVEIFHSNTEGEVNSDGFTRGYPARRGTHSDVATASQGAITGFGIVGYDLALRGLKEILAKK